MNCEACRELLTAYLKEELDEAQRGAVEGHVATCAACATELEGTRKVLAEIEHASEPAVTALTQELIDEAIRARASDLHIQPRLHGEAKALVRYRIDGVLQEVRQLDWELYLGVSHRIRLMAGISLVERRVPHDGRIRHQLEGRDYDLRVSVLPAVAGPNTVMRIFSPSGQRYTLDQVHLVGEQRRQLEAMLSRPHGMVIVTGPTGSGKTTTLYALLHHLNSPGNHLMTVEDPVEWAFDGVTQMHLNRHVGLDFKAAMRAVMRQDPDIILCGEIRDRETAELCAQAAMTGHLVLTQLHTQDAVQVIRRLLDIGLERFMVSQSLLGATAQRLVRVLCAECKEEYDPRVEASAGDWTSRENEVAWLQRAGVAELPEKLWRARRGGCESCRNTGYRGLTAIYEVLTLDDELLNLLAVQNAPLPEIERAAAQKVTPMRVTAADRIRAGEVSVHAAMVTLTYLPEYG